MIAGSLESLSVLQSFRYKDISQTDMMLYDVTVTMTCQSVTIHTVVVFRSVNPSPFHHDDIIYVCHYISLKNSILTGV